jgi:hypothetical protein
MLIIFYKTILRNNQEDCNIRIPRRDLKFQRFAQTCTALITTPAVPWTRRTVNSQAYGSGNRHEGVQPPA